jgi:hypothetical protein
MRCIISGVSHHDCFQFVPEGVENMLLSDFSKLNSLCPKLNIHLQYYAKYILTGAILLNLWIYRIGAYQNLLTLLQLFIIFPPPVQLNKAYMFANVHAYFPENCIFSKCACKNKSLS